MKSEKLPVVSAMVVVHNRVDFIEECLSSILIQDFTDFEVVIYDDGSDDGTDVICREYRNRYPEKIFYYRSDVNRGVGRARQEALKHCRGWYVAICDSDDIFLPKRFSTQVQALDADEHTGIVFGRCIEIDEQGNPTGTVHYVKEPAKLATGNVAVLTNNLLNPTVMARKQAIVEVGGFNDYKIWEDLDLFLRIMQQYAIKYLDVDLTYYRSHDMNTSTLENNTLTQVFKQIMWSLKRAKGEIG